MGYSALSPEISYGISFGFDWKGLDFSVLFQGSGNQTYRASKKSSRGWQEGGSAVTYLNDYSWTGRNTRTEKKSGFLVCQRIPRSHTTTLIHLCGSKTLLI